MTDAVTTSGAASDVTAVAGILLAAGASRRLGEPKQLVVDEHGAPMVVRSAMQLLASGCAPVVVVVGANEQPVRHALHALPVHICVNDHWEEGVGASIRCGIAWLQAQQGQPPPHRPEHRVVQATIIAACDMPGVTTGHLVQLVAVSEYGTRRVGSVYGDQADKPTGEPTVFMTTRGIPALFPKADWTILSQLAGDRGAKKLIELPETLSVFLRQGHNDIDTPADLAQWRASSVFSP